MLDLVQALFGETLEAAEIFVRRRIDRDRDQSIVPDSVALFGLFRLDYAEEPGRHNAADKGRLIHQDEDIERVAIAAESLRDKAEVEGKNGAGREDAAELEETGFFPVRIFVSAALGSVDHSVEVVRLGIKRGEISVAAHALDSSHDEPEAAFR